MFQWIPRILFLVAILGSSEANELLYFAFPYYTYALSSFISSAVSWSRIENIGMFVRRSFVSSCVRVTSSIAGRFGYGRPA